MVIDLSQEQQQALEAGQPVEFRDGQRKYYIITGEQFEKIRLLEEVEQVDTSLYEAGEIHLFEKQ